MLLVSHVCMYDVFQVVSLLADRFNHLVSKMNADVQSCTTISFGTNLNTRYITKLRSSSTYHMSYVKQKQTAQFHSTIKCTITNSKRLSLFIKKETRKKFSPLYLCAKIKISHVCLFMNELMSELDDLKPESEFIPEHES